MDPAKRTKEEMFDTKDFAAQMSELTSKPWNHRDLNLRGVKLQKDNRTVTFVVDSIDYKFDMMTKRITKVIQLKKLKREPTGQATLLTVPISLTQKIITCTS